MAAANQLWQLFGLLPCVQWEAPGGTETVGGGGSLEEQKLAGEIEKGQEEGDTELNRPIQRQRQ